MRHAINGSRARKINRQQTVASIEPYIEVSHELDFTQDSESISKVIECIGNLFYGNLR